MGTLYSTAHVKCAGREEYTPRLRYQSGIASVVFVKVADVSSTPLTVTRRGVEVSSQEGQVGSSKGMLVMVFQREGLTDAHSFYF